MGIRVSTSQTFTQGSNAILDNQSKVSQTQLQLSKGPAFSSRRMIRSVHRWR